MKRVVSLLAVVSVGMALACAGAEDEAWQGTGAEFGLQAQSQGIDSYREGSTTTESFWDAGTDGGTPDRCTPPEYQKVPPVPVPMELDKWDFARTPLLPITTATRSMYLVAFRSPVDRTRLYVYGIDVAQGRFIFAGSLARASVGSLAQRAGIDIGNFQASGTVDPRASIGLQIEGPPPPPPPPNIHDPSIQNYGKHAWEVAVDLDMAVQKLRL